jgi:hypothetical protein
MVGGAAVTQRTTPREIVASTNGTVELRVFVATNATSYRRMSRLIPSTIN